ncbi:MAG: hypothetical protein D6702_08905 [Planctomycetota bacterium]|nr:MAG: hypothetical protein D6702_08905 [Planctomycetota bacterium]
MNPAPPSPENRPAPVKVLFEGRYRKLVRDLPQTVFYCPQCKGRGCARCEGYGKLTRDSVQELIARVAMPRLKARRNKFHGAGREDLDVRMLGRGRPFVFEALKCKRPMIDLEELAAEVNRRAAGRIEIFDLRFTDRKRVAEIKETRCPKEYGALVELVEARPAAAIGARFAELRDRGRIPIVQETPARVAHRRAVRDRERWLEIVSAEAEDGRWRVVIRTAHGTYVKEAISGDEGRTRPSLAELLGVGCRCVELDVLEILPPEEDA